MENFIHTAAMQAIHADHALLPSGWAKDVGEELRQLEYSQRLHHRGRNVIAVPGGSTGQLLFELTLSGGNRALAGKSAITENSPADLVSIDALQHSWLTETNVLDHFVFASGPKPDCVWVNGIKRVTGGRHLKRSRIEARFATVMKELVADL